MEKALPRLFHRLDGSVPSDSKLNNPFHYKPDSLILAAAKELQSHLPPEPEEGKMWGVLVVEYQGQLGFINAYSGQISKAMADKIGPDWAGCPPVFDYLQPDGYFKTHEAEITAINNRLDALLDNDDYLRQKRAIAKLKKEGEDKIERQRSLMNEAKQRRHERRAQGGLTDKELSDMERESQFLKAELHRAKVNYRKSLADAESKLSVYESEINSLQRHRTILSERLQSWLFNHFVLLNARGERKPMPEIFREYYLSNASAKLQARILALNPGSDATLICPSGAGECCEPKLLQYAYLHGMRPLRMASFWWGPCLGLRLQRHGQFYPACSGRCKPILSWMLRGLAVRSYQLTNSVSQKLRIIFEDNYLFVVDKPSGMLSVPGTTSNDSVLKYLVDRFHCTVYPVHRLDMATSGLMVVAKDAGTQQALQREFENRTVKKEYEAIVIGEIGQKKGRISLPLSPDLMDRPRQKVDFEHGKEAVTEYEVLSSKGGETRLRLHPLTGRTHQLRVHCASPLGLNAPIKGDALYGTDAGRLYLQARRLSFVYPVDGRQMSFTLPPDF